MSTDKPELTASANSKERPHTFQSRHQYPTLEAKGDLPTDPMSYLHDQASISVAKLLPLKTTPHTKARGHSPGPSRPHPDAFQSTWRLSPSDKALGLTDVYEVNPWWPVLPTARFPVLKALPSPRQGRQKPPPTVTRE